MNNLSISKLFCRRGSADNDIYLGAIVIVVIVIIFIKTYSYFNQRIVDITCSSNMSSLTEVLYRYKNYASTPIETVLYPDRKINCEELVNKKFLTFNIKCPKKGVYFLDQNNIVNCSKHGPYKGE